MAGSRLHKIGTIFSRANGMLQTGVMKLEDKPIWYDVYAMHPPIEVPRYDRPAPDIELRDIFYEEDIIRAKFHKEVPSKQLKAVNLADRKNQTTSQKFIELYKNYRAQGALDDEKIFEVALEKVQDNIRTAPSTPKTEGVTDHKYDWAIDEPDMDLDLVSSFNKAKVKQNLSPPDPAEDLSKEENATQSQPKMSLQDYLKDNSEEEKK